MSTPKLLLLFMTLVLLTYFLIDIIDIGTKKLSVDSASRHTTQIAMMRSIEEGGIRTKHLPRIDVEQFHDEFEHYGALNAGTKAMNTSYTSVYAVVRLAPFAAVQMGKSAEARSMKFLGSAFEKYVWHYPRHRVVFIWDEK
ncbi:hypothetical protein [Paenibacillus sp. Leaf72]|uniref:hypothetical protein n=1 Tax=Paenibacillus sp. Leaf72 TaxID=1736234 RepID=UPI0006F9A8BF|nr:hypothetical protein [Paenibacillus sp. Leaf72]KQN97026.1 hypothetical protein ASF12_23440 [Paenibacillus sp. Leaf72]